MQSAAYLCCVLPVCGSTKSMFLYLTQPTLTAYLWSLKVYKPPSEGDGPGVKRSFSLAGSRLTAALDMDKMRWKTSPGVQSQER